MTCTIGVSLDGFAAGPDQRPDEPLGTGGERLHEWMFGKGTEADAEIAASITEGVGAFVMGRKMFARRGAVGSGVEGLVGRRPALPRAGVRADP